MIGGKVGGEVEMEGVVGVLCPFPTDDRSGLLIGWEDGLLITAHIQRGLAIGQEGSHPRRFTWILVALALKQYHLMGSLTTVLRDFADSADSVAISHTAGPYGSHVQHRMPMCLSPD